MVSKSSASGAVWKVGSIGTLLLSAAILIFLGWRYLSGPEITVEDLVANNPGFGAADEVTAEYCTAEIECVEAWETPYGVYMRFDSTAEATHWATIIGGDGAQWKTFVLDARGQDLTDEERVTAVQVLLAYDGV